MTTEARAKVIQTLREQKGTIEVHLADLWRRFAEDFIKAGYDRNEVVDTMLAVAATQGMVLHGATKMAEHMRQMADKFQLAADHGMEFPAREH